MATRSPICVVLGHVDHGKSSILDYIRGTRITSKEAGAITQAIGASVIPMQTIEKVCGDLLRAANMSFSLPGLLFIDTPGHAAFTSLRKRGGNLADIAILVVDINEGLKQQTIEAMRILRESKTPFVVAANKIDLVPGFKSNPKKNIIQNITEQQPKVMQDIETKMYELIGNFYEQEFKAERFDRVADYTQELALVPCSAHTGDGMPEVLMVVSGLAQKYLEQSLQIKVDGPAKGTILEVKEHKGLGTAVDVIIYDGTLHKGDSIVIGGVDEPISTKIKLLMQPAKVADMRDKSVKFLPVNEVSAATGVRISAPDLDKVIAGMPIRSVTDENKETVFDAVQEDVADVLIETEKEGIIIKADTLGSVEALINLCGTQEIPIRRASIGNITRKDIIDAESNFDIEPTNACILGFNVSVDASEKSEKVYIVTSEIIYELIDKYLEWKEKLTKAIQEKAVQQITRPAKITFMNNCTFRQSNPAIIGVEVLGGQLKKGHQLLKTDGSVIGFVKTIQKNKEHVDTLDKGDEAAISVDGPTVGRQIQEGDTFFVNLDEQEFRELKEHKKQLAPDDIEVLKEYAELRRKDNPLWGV